MNTQPGTWMDRFFLGLSTAVTVPFVMPAIGSSVVVAVKDSSWMALGYGIFVQGMGFFNVQSVPSPTSVSLTNLGSSANQAPGTTMQLPGNALAVGASSTGSDWPSGSMVFNVGQAPWMYSTIAAAIAAAVTAGVSVSNRALIKVWPGTYTMTTTINVPSGVGIVGSGDLTQLVNATTNMFTLTGSDTFFTDFLVQGSATAGIYVFECANQNDVTIRRVNLLKNGGNNQQAFLHQSGATWATLEITDCIIDSHATSNYQIVLQNTAPAARLCDVFVQNLFCDTFFLTTFGGGINVIGCQDVRFRNCNIRGTDAFATGPLYYNTGIRLDAAGTGQAEIEVYFSAFGGANGADGGVAIFGNTTTTVVLANSYAPGAVFSGTSHIYSSQTARV